MREPMAQEVDVEGKAPAEGQTAAEPPVRPRTAAGTSPHLRQRRNPADDVIESGEIVERRSLVIRSQRPPGLVYEPAALAPGSVVRRWSWRGLWLAGAIVFGFAAVTGLGAKPDPGATEALAARAEMIGTTLDGEARAALVRAEAMASSPVLRAAIATDASTLADMARDRDLTFTLESGDVIEIFQVRGGERSLLLRLPENAAPLEAPSAGNARIDRTKHAFVALATAKVTPDRAITGEIVLSTPIDLGPVAARVAEHARGAVLSGLSDPIVLIASQQTPNVTFPIAMKTPAAGTLALAAVVPETTETWGYACMGLSVLCVGVFGFVIVRARRSMG